MKKFFFKAAAACAVFGLVFCIIGAAAGGKLTGMRIDWDNDRPHVAYSTVTMDDLPQGKEPSSGPQASTGKNDAAPHSAENAPAKTPSADSTGAAPNTAAEQLFDGAEIHSLELELGGAQVFLEAADRWSFTAEDPDTAVAAVRNGVLKITSRSSSLSSAAVYTVTVPQDVQLRELDIELGGGELKSFGTIQCGSLDVEVGAGGIVLQDVRVAGECNLDAGLGSIELNGALARGAEIDCSIGSVVCRLTAVERYDYAVECGAGSVKLDDSEFSGAGVSGKSISGAPVRYEIECGMGSVEILHNS